MEREEGGTRMESSRGAVKSCYYRFSGRNVFVDPSEGYVLTRDSPRRTDWFRYHHLTEKQEKIHCHAAFQDWVDCFRSLWRHWEADRSILLANILKLGSRHLKEKQERSSRDPTHGYWAPC